MFFIQIFDIKAKLIRYYKELTQFSSTTFLFFWKLVFGIAPSLKQ